MFNKKSKLKKYSLAHNKSSVVSKNLKSKRSSRRLLKRANPSFRFKKLFILAVLVAAIILGIYAMFLSNYFLISTITFQQETETTQALEDQIRANIQNTIGQNIFFVDTEDLQTRILEAFPEIEEIEINKNLPKTLEISFSQYPLAANVINESTTIRKSYIINSIGYAVKEDLENTGLPYIKIVTDEPVNTNIPVIESTKLTYMLGAITYFQERFGMRVIELEYKKIPREIHILTERDFYIWLDIQVPYEDQLQKLKKALVKLDIYTENLEYIDLRIAGENGDKIIYKRR